MSIKKSKRPRQDALVKHILDSCSPQPGEEDFWAIVLMLTKSERLIFAINGSLKPIVEHTVKLIGSNRIRLKEQTSILTFQGEKARWAMEHVRETPGITSLTFVNCSKIFPTMDPATTTISLDEEYVTP
jgi:hypothetical protein